MWSCTDAGEYEMKAAEKAERGTDIVMHIAEGEQEYLEEYKIREILEKYCSFMPVEIYLENIKDVYKRQLLRYQILPLRFLSWTE